MGWAYSECVNKTPEPSPSVSEKVDAAIARTQRLADSTNLLATMGPSTVHSEMFSVVLKDNAVLIEELQRTRQELADLRAQRRLESVRELEAQFPRKGRRSIARLTG